MNKDVFKTIEELKGRIDEEINKKDMKLEELEKMERIEEMTNNKLESILENITEDDIKVFEYYKGLINTTNTTFEEIIEDLTDTGIIEMIRTISSVYVKHIYAGDFKATKKEMSEISKMFLFVKLYNLNNNYKELFLEGILFSTVASAKEVSK